MFAITAAKDDPYPTKAQRRILETAARRPGGNICPTPGIYAAAQRALVNALLRQGFAKYDGLTPVITDIGREAIARTYAVNGGSRDERHDQ